jgi:PQQ system protein
MTIDVHRDQRISATEEAILNEEVKPMTVAHEREDLLNKLGLNVQNRAAIGRVLGTGNIGQATEKADGRMAATIRIRPDEIAWDPSILVLPHGGDIDLELINDDLNTHCALLPSNGDRKFIWLVNHSRGRATLNLDGPGYYWFSSPTGNDEGRGLTGAIVVLGDVPPEARLDRPDQPRP